MPRRFLGSALGRLASAFTWLRRDSRALLLVGGALAGFTGAAAVVRLPPGLCAVVFFALAFALCALVLGRLRFDLVTTGLILGGFCLYLLYTSYTWYGERNYDGPEQVKYIEYIVQQHSLPAANHCFICHHPPAYYLSSAVVYAFCQATGIAEPVRGVQLYSLVLFLTFVVFGVLLARRFTSDVRQIRLTTALIVYWPYSVHNCIRVHNDTLVSTLVVVALYFVVRWLQEGRQRDLYLAAILSALGVLTKSNGIISVAILLVAMGVSFVRSRHRLRDLRHAALVVLLLAAAVGLNTAGKGTLAQEGSGVTGELCQRVLGSACSMATAEQVGNRPYNYFYFDVQSFLKEPFLIARHDGSGREYFWNHLLKSSLLGTHNEVPDRELAYEFNHHVAAGLNFLLLAMTGYLLYAFTSVKQAAVRRYWAIALSLVLLLAFMIGFRILIPWSHHTDFRHVFPVLVLVAMLYAAAVASFRDRGLFMGTVGYLLAVPFLLLSVFYFIPKYDWAIRVTARVVKLELADYQTIVAAGADWDRHGNLIIEGNHTLDFHVTGRPTVRTLDVTLDNNDQYEVKLFGKGGPRTLRLGPSRREGVKGLERYTEKLEPPLENVTGITLRPVAGDRAYSLGHLVVR